MSDLILRNARIWTGDDAHADAAVVRDGSFVFVGASADLNPEPAARVLDLEGRFVMPGFADSHAHLLGTGFAMQVCRPEACPGCGRSRPASGGARSNAGARNVDHWCGLGSESLAG